MKSHPPSLSWLETCPEFRVVHRLLPISLPPLLGGEGGLRLGSCPEEGEAQPPTLGGAELDTWPGARALRWVGQARWEEERAPGRSRRDRADRTAWGLGKKRPEWKEGL